MGAPASWIGCVMGRTNCLLKTLCETKMVLNLRASYESRTNGLLENVLHLFPMNLLGHGSVTTCVYYFLRFLV